MNTPMSWGIMIYTTHSQGYLLSGTELLVAADPRGDGSDVGGCSLLPGGEGYGRSHQPQVEEALSRDAEPMQSPGQRARAVSPAFPCSRSTTSPWSTRPRGRFVSAVSNVSFTLEAGESLGLVGESGCGKTSVAMSLLRLQADNAEFRHGEIRLNGQNLLALSEPEMRTHRWKDISMVFQGAMNSWNPVSGSGPDPRGDQPPLQPRPPRWRAASARRICSIS